MLGCHGLTECGANMLHPKQFPVFPYSSPVLFRLKEKQCGREVAR